MLKVRLLAVVLLTQLWPAALDNLRSGSWLAWADDTMAHYAAIQCSW